MIGGLASRCSRQNLSTGNISGSAASPCGTGTGTPAIDADRTRAIGHDLKQAAGHDQVLDEMERLVGISEIRMKEHGCRQAEQREHDCNDARLKAEYNQKTTADFYGDGPGVGQWRR